MSAGVADGRAAALSIAMSRTLALEEALKWTLKEVRSFAVYHEMPDSPYWNDYRHAQAVLEGRDPDEDGGP